MATRPRRPSPILGAASSLIGEASGSLVGRESRFRHSFEVPVEHVRPDDRQPRKVFAAEEIVALAATMEAHGQLQPVLVRPDPEARGRWILIAGERRWRAARTNGWRTLLAIEHGGDPEVATLLENLQRVDLSPVEEARGIRRLLEEKGWTQDRTAEALGKSKAELSGLLRILQLPNDLLEAVLTSELAIPKNALIELARVPRGPALEQLLRLARADRLTVRAIRAAREPKPEPPDAASPADMLEATRLQAFARRLRRAREAGPALDEAARRELRALRDEIDALLATGS